MDAQTSSAMPPARDLSVEEIRRIIDDAHASYMASLPPIEPPTKADMMEGDCIFSPLTA